jgi:hypothetical protein
MEAVLCVQHNRIPGCDNIEQVAITLNLFQNRLKTQLDSVSLTKHHCQTCPCCSKQIKHTPLDSPSSREHPQPQNDLLKHVGITALEGRTVLTSFSAAIDGLAQHLRFHFLEMFFNFDNDTLLSC